MDIDNEPFEISEMMSDIMSMMDKELLEISFQNVVPDLGFRIPDINKIDDEGNVIDDENDTLDLVSGRELSTVSDGDSSQMSDDGLGKEEIDLWNITENLQDDIIEVEQNGVPDVKTLSDLNSSFLNQRASEGTPAMSSVLQNFLDKCFMLPFGNLSITQKLRVWKQTMYHEFDDDGVEVQQDDSFYEDSLANRSKSMFSQPITDEIKDDKSLNDNQLTGLPYSEKDVKTAAAVVVVSGEVLVGVMIVLSNIPSLQTHIPGTSINPIGLLAVSSAIYLFGCCGLMMKLPSLMLQYSDPVVFQLYNSIGIAMATFPILLVQICKGVFQFHPWGFLGSVDITIVSLFAFLAIQRIGITVAPPIWAGVGMVTSFMWGVTAFREPVNNICASTLAVLLLIVGVWGVSLSDMSRKTAPTSKEDLDNVDIENSHENLQQGSILTVEDDTSFYASRSLVKVFFWNVKMPFMFLFQQFPAISLCLIAGLCDGSLMVPFKLSTDLEGNASLSNTLNYLASFGVCSLVTTPCIFGLYCAVIKRAIPPLDFKRLALPGIVSGALWSMGNIMSVHSTEYLGIAIGFPLTQTAIVVNALWGILFFKEVDPSNLMFLTRFSVSLCCILSGASLLSCFG